jgi:2-polyprenyl-3-methyl-5-hydroxy-6-metoxy-1,4-benzoquinol methylase
VREVQLRGERQLSFLWRHQTKDVTKNHPLDEGLAQVAALLGRDFLNAHLHTRSQEIQLVFSRKGKPSLRIGALAAEDQPAENAAHDKAKQRPLSLDAPFWTDLGLTHEVKGERQLVPAMSRKWKQINKFIEVMSAALRSSPLAASPEVHVVDFGSGKGYLTFAMHDWLLGQGKQARVTGVELREDMVRLCNAAAARHGLAGLHFDQGDVRSYTPARLDVMIALHACDTATSAQPALDARAQRLAADAVAVVQRGQRAGVEEGVGQARQLEARRLHAGGAAARWPPPRPARRPPSGSRPPTTSRCL